MVTFIEVIFNGKFHFLCSVRFTCECNNRYKLWQPQLSNQNRLHKRTEKIIWFLNMLSHCSLYYTLWKHEKSSGFLVFSGGIHSVHPSPFLQGEALSLQLNFQKGEGGLGMTSTFTGGCWEKGGGWLFSEGGGEGGGCNFHIKNESVTIKR